MIRIAVVGATGNVGREILNALAEWKTPIDVTALASNISKGKQVSFGEKGTIQVHNIDGCDFGNFDLVFLATSAAISERLAPIALSCGCTVIDNSSQFRMQKDVPLIVPEANPEDCTVQHSLIANPNCVAIQVAVALKPILHLSGGIKRLVMSTYQSVSGAGREAMDELHTQTKNCLMFQSAQPHIFPKRIAFNCIPQIGDITDSGSSEEEDKIGPELQKILHSSMGVSVTAVRVPVFVCHGVSINVEFNDEANMQEIQTLLAEASGVILMNDNQKYATHIECVGDNGVYVSRVRNDPSNHKAINMWVVADNVRKGAAWNAVQIASLLYQQ